MVPLKTTTNKDIIGLCYYNNTELECESNYTFAESSNICYNYFTKEDSCTGTKTWAQSYQFNGGRFKRIVANIEKNKFESFNTNYERCSEIDKQQLCDDFVGGCQWDDTDRNNTKCRPSFSITTDSGYPNWWNVNELYKGMTVFLIDTTNLKEKDSIKNIEAIGNVTRTKQSYINYNNSEASGSNLRINLDKKIIPSNNFSEVRFKNENEEYLVIVQIMKMHIKYIKIKSRRM